MQHRRPTAVIHRPNAAGVAPDRTDELMLYQMMVGAWPLDLILEEFSTISVHTVNKTIATGRSSVTFLNASEASAYCC